MPDAAVTPYPSYSLLRPRFSWDLLKSTSPCSPGLFPPSAMQALQQQLLGYSEILTAILTIKPRPRSQQRSLRVTQILLRKV